MPTKATKTIKQALTYKPQHAAWFEQTQALFNRVVAFYFEVIAAHPGILELSSKDALTALEKLTHATGQNPRPVMPLSEIAHDIPAMFRRAAIHAALGSAKSFYTHLTKWHKRKEQVQARGKKFTIRPPVPPRRWNKSVTCYSGMWKCGEGSSVLLKAIRAVSVPTAEHLLHDTVQGNQRKGIHPVRLSSFAQTVRCAAMLIAMPASLLASACLQDIRRNRKSLKLLWKQRCYRRGP